jgi:hypothetical protein
MRRGRVIFWTASGTLVAGVVGLFLWLRYDLGSTPSLPTSETFARLARERLARDDRPPEPWAPVDPWWRRVSIDAFDRANPGKSWPSARRAVVAFGAELSYEPSRTGDESEDAWAAAVAADGYDCPDPLVQFVRGRYLLREDRPGRPDRRTERADAVAALVAAADGFRATPAGYPAFVRCLALIETARAVLSDPVPRKAGNPPASASEYQAAAAALFPEVAADPQLNPYAALLLIDAFGDLARPTRQDRMAVVEPLVAALEAAGRPRSLALTARGDALTTYAWDARGSGWASEVTGDGWKAFAERLKLARAALTEAWALDPANTYAPERMITVCMGDGSGRAEMERWYARAIDAFPGNASAVSRKMLALEPKWGGSQAEMVLFGRELTRTATDPRAQRLPLELVNVHWRLAEYAGGRRGGPSPDYFADNDDAWDDVRRGCDAFLAKVPASRYHRTRYAVVAAWAGHWDVAAAEFDRLGDRHSLAVVPEGVVKALRAQAKRKAGAPSADPGGKAAGGKVTDGV